MRKGPSPGQCFPLGASVFDGGVNFSLFSQSATAVELLLFDDADDARPARVIALDPRRHRTFFYWHAFVPGVGAGQHYGYRVHGPFDPAHGHRFDGTKLLLDPYARAVAYGDRYAREAARHPGDNCGRAMKAVVVDPRGYDWEEDTPLDRPFDSALIYELHVGGFTRHPSSGVDAARRGTYAGLAEKVLHLQDLGVTAVELLPVQQFDPQHDHPPLTNYWGYQPVAFFAPHRGYSARADPLGPLNEFRDLVKALHRAGIEVILDVVFNHSAEGDADGPTLSFRGLENRTYYLLDGQGRYANYSGCGNTINGNQSVVRRLILDCLRYWVQVMHVDGFRFDLASVLARDETGRPLLNPPVLLDIESDPVLAGTKIIAEAWDAAGLYQVGKFVGHRWAEWNGPFRDDVRRFVKGDKDTVRHLADRLRGSPDLYPPLPDRFAHRCVNFVTCHDGFTLEDLVSYNRKHNEANGENNRDGSDENLSWNCGAEGPSDDPAVRALRTRQVKNLLTVLFLAQGTPMLLMGDEARRSQRGNNNAYCQDNELSWLDWDGMAGQQDLIRFLRGLVLLRRTQAPYKARRTWSTGDDRPREITWHGVRAGAPDWSRDSHTLAFSLCGPDGTDQLYVALNAYWQPLMFWPPPPAGKGWHRVIDTARPAPDDYREPGTEEPVRGEYRLEARSAVILLAR